MDSESVAARLREVMFARGLNIKAFAAEIGQKTQRVDDVLRGKQRIPADLLINAIERFDIDANWLLAGVKSVMSAGGTDEEVALSNTVVAMALNLPDDLREVWLDHGRAFERLAIQRGDARHVRRRNSGAGVEGPAGPSSGVHEEPATQVFHGPVGQAGTGDIVNHAPVTIRQRGK